MTDYIVNSILGVIKGLLTAIFKLIIKYNYWICVFGCLTALFLYIMGFKKAGKYIGLSFVLFFIMEFIRIAVNI